MNDPSIFKIFSVGAEFLLGLLDDANLCKNKQKLKAGRPLRQALDMDVVQKKNSKAQERQKKKNTVNQQNFVHD